MLFAFVQRILSAVTGINVEINKIAKQQRDDTAAIMKRLDAQDAALNRILLAVEPKPATTLVLSLGTPEPQ